MAKTSVNLSKKEALDLYYDMLYIRKFEEKCGSIYGMGKIAGFCHLVIGQEAICAGIKKVFKKGDTLVTGYRCHGHALICGADPRAVMAELMGRETGVSKGKGGSMHIFDTKNGFFGGHGIVGAQVPLGTGMAFANKYNNSDNVSFVCFGDGAANQGQVYEAFNMAKLWNLPVIYIIENNRYAMGTSTARHTMTKDLYTRGAGYDIAGEKVDGMDLLSTIDALSRAVEFTKKEQSPYIIEMDTYRYRGHSMSDPAKYRAKEELDKTRNERDPIENFGKYIIAQKFATSDDLEKMLDKISEEVNSVYEQCESDSFPNDSELSTEVYCG